MKRIAGVICASVLFMLSAGSAAAAPGIGLDAARLPPQARIELRANIDKARAVDAAAFREVRDIVARSRALDMRSRGRKAPIALHLAGLGNKALMPMIELVAFDAGPAASAANDERVSVRRDLIEAVGLLRDARAMPVLKALLDRETDVDTTRTVTEAIGRMETDDAATTITSALAKASGARATAILAGMGTCHREVVARTLAERLASRPDDATSLVVIRSLSRVGNAWAWKTLSSRTEEHATRGVAARALLDAYVRSTSDVREAAAKALLVVDAPESVALVEAARRGASADGAVALDALAARLASNPTRRR